MHIADVSILYFIKFSLIPELNVLSFTPDQKKIRKNLNKKTKSRKSHVKLIPNCRFSLLCMTTNGDGGGGDYNLFRPEDLHRIRVEHMERQLANLTGLVQKALTQGPSVAAPAGINQNYLGVPGQYRGMYKSTFFISFRFYLKIKFSFQFWL